MDIHHYTRASTLSLILQSGKIRFRRADLLDDGSEMPFKTAHLGPFSYFVSSWSMGSSEQSGQWYRYADLHQGVRITLPSVPFAFHRLRWKLSRDCSTSSRSDFRVGIELNNVAAPFTIAEMLGNGYVIIPLGHMPRDFGGPVEYVSHPALRVSELLSGDDQQTITYDAGKRGRIKSEAWSDQAEYRFVLMAQEGPALDRWRCSESYDAALLDLLENNSVSRSQVSKPASVEFIDLPLAKGILNRMTVTMGSNISDYDREAVRQVVRLHAPKARIVESSMNVRCFS